MVGTRQLVRLLDHAADANAKVVLVGDHHQLPEIDAGGLFRALARRLDAVELTNNRRQAEAWEAAALDELRHGDVATAVAAYQRAGRITLADSAEAARGQLVADWAHAYETMGGEPGVMVALRRTDVADLNARARARLVAAGQLTGPLWRSTGSSSRPEIGSCVYAIRTTTVGTLRQVGFELRRTLTLLYHYDILLRDLDDETPVRLLGCFDEPRPNPHPRRPPE